MVRGKAELADDTHALRFRGDALEGDAMLHQVALDAGQVLEEIEVPEHAPVLAVGHRLQADGLLLPHEVADLAVLDFAQCSGGQLTGLVPLARRLEARRAQEAANHVAAERRDFSFHGDPPNQFVMRIRRQLLVMLGRANVVSAIRGFSVRLVEDAGLLCLRHFLRWIRVSSPGKARGSPCEDDGVWVSHVGFASCGPAAPDRFIGTVVVLATPR